MFPLAKDLVDERFNQFAAEVRWSRPIIAALRRSVARDATAWSLERELAELTSASTNSVEQRMQLIAFRFYLHRLVAGVTRDWQGQDRYAGFNYYGELLSTFYAWHQAHDHAPVRLVSFNYDTLLDSAVEDFFPDWKLTDFAAYIRQKDFRLIKPHGSINWWLEFLTVPNEERTSRSGTNVMIEAAMAAAASGDLDLEEEFAMRVPELDGMVESKVDVPALAVPIADKAGFECPTPFIEDLGSELPNVSHVVLMGWRAAEQHFVRLLLGFALDADAAARADPRCGLMPGFSLCVVGGNKQDCSETIKNLGAVASKAASLEVGDDGLSRFMESLDTHMTSFFLAGCTPVGTRSPS